MRVYRIDTLDGLGKVHALGNVRQAYFDWLYDPIWDRLDVFGGDVMRAEERGEISQVEFERINARIDEYRRRWNKLAAEGEAVDTSDWLGRWQVKAAEFRDEVAAYLKAAGRATDYNVEHSGVRKAVLFGGVALGLGGLFYVGWRLSR